MLDMYQIITHLRAGGITLGILSGNIKEIKKARQNNNTINELSVCSRFMNWCSVYELKYIQGVLYKSHQHLRKSPYRQHGGVLKEGGENQKNHYVYLRL